MSEDTNDQATPRKEDEATQLDVLAPFMENAEPGLSVGGDLRDRPAQRILRTLQSFGKVRKAGITMIAIGVAFAGGYAAIDQAVDMKHYAGAELGFADTYVAVLESNYSGARKLREYRSGLATAAEGAMDFGLEDHIHDHDTTDPVLEAVLADLDKGGEVRRTEVADWFTQHEIVNDTVKDALARQGIVYVEERGQYMVDMTQDYDQTLAPSLPDLQHTIATVAAQTGATLAQSASMLSEGVESLMIASDLCDTGDNSFCITDQIVFQGDRDAVVVFNAFNGRILLDSEPREDGSPVVKMSDFGADGQDNRPQKDASFDLGGGRSGVMTITTINQETGETEVVASFPDRAEDALIQEMGGNARR